METMTMQLSLPVKELFQKIHSSSYKLTYYGAGCCSHFVGWATLLPGSSKSMIELAIPYHKGAAMHFLGYDPEKFVSSTISVDYAKKAYINSQKALLKSVEGDLSQLSYEGIIGVGAAGSLKANYDKKSADQVYLAILVNNVGTVYNLKFDKSFRTREEQDHLSSVKLIQLLSNAVEGKYELEPTILADLTGEDKFELVKQFEVFELMFESLSLHGIKNIVFMANKKIVYDVELDGYIVLAGSFNPIHEGHINVAKTAAKNLKIDESKIIFELSVPNADKGMHDKEQVMKIVEKINSLGWNVMITQIPYFSEKNIFLKNGYFILGADTFKRLINTKYYSNSYEMMVWKLGEFRKKNNRIVFAPRLNPSTGNVIRIQEMVLPEILKGITEEVDFRQDISSTEIRQSEVTIPFDKTETSGQKTDKE